MKVSKSTAILISVGLIIIASILILILINSNTIKNPQNINSEDYITIKSDGKSFSVNLNKINELNEYLKESFDLTTEIDRMKFHIGQ